MPYPYYNAIKSNRARFIKLLPYEAVLFGEILLSCAKVAQSSTCRVTD